MMKDLPLSKVYQLLENCRPKVNACNGDFPTAIGRQSIPLRSVCYFRCMDSKYLVTFSSRTLPKS